MYLSGSWFRRPSSPRCCHPWRRGEQPCLLPVPDGGRWGWLPELAWLRPQPMGPPRVNRVLKWFQIFSKGIFFLNSNFWHLYRPFGPGWWGRRCSFLDFGGSTISGLRPQRGGQPKGKRNCKIARIMIRLHFNHFLTADFLVKNWRCQQRKNILILRNLSTQKML